MDALRRQQINEILNYDTDMNLRVLALQRKLYGDQKEGKQVNH
jgi:hypothetical protein